MKTKRTGRRKGGRGAPTVWDGLTVAQRDRLIATCRPGDPAAAALGLTGDWSNLDALGPTAAADARQIAADFAALIVDGAERVVVRDMTPGQVPE